MAIFSTLILYLRRFKNFLLLLCNGLFLGSILSNIINPINMVWIAPFGFLFFILYIFHLAIVIIYYKRNGMLALPAFILLVIASFFVRNTFNISVSSEKSGLKIATWNVKNFDLYNWTKNKDSRNKIISQIKKLDADIITINEFYTDKRQFDNIEELQKIGFPYYYFQPTFVQKDSDAWGLAIFSKYPLSHKMVLPNIIQNNRINRIIRATASTPQGVVDIYAAHFQSIHFHYDDYDCIENLKNQWTLSDIVHIKVIAEKILKAYKNRILQIQQLEADLAYNKNNIVLCCDLNDIPNSYAYHLLTAHLQDAFIARGSGFSNTINIIFPILRIDYILTSPLLQVNFFEKINTNLSDHNILVTYIETKKSTNSQ